MQDFWIMPALFSQSEDGKTITVKFDKEEIEAQYGATDILDLGKYGLGTVNVYLWNVCDAKTEQVLEGNTDEGIYYFTYTTDYVPAVLTVDPAEGEVESLKDFTLSYSNDLIWPNSDCNGVITITDENGNVVGTFTYDDLAEGMSYDQFDEDCIAVSFSLPTMITAAGTYTMNIPEGMFYLGQNWDECEATTFTWTVSGVLDGINNVNADDDAPAYNVAGQRVYSTAKGIIIKNGRKVVRK